MNDVKKITLTLMEHLTDIQLDDLLCQLDKIEGYQFSLNSLDFVMKEKKIKSKEDGMVTINENVYTGNLFDIKPEVIPTVNF
jgi:hypothetical protein